MTELLDGGLGHGPVLVQPGQRNRKLVVFVPRHEADYGKGIFARDDFARMAELLRGLKGRFILR